jgi:hypothetical protein
LSNLRNYLVHRTDIPADDKAVVDRWIDEMEKLRAQNAAAATAVPVPPPVAPPAAPVIGLRAPAPEQPALDVSAQSVPSEGAAEAAPVYTRWWFWGTVGAVVAAGAVTAVVLAGKGGSNVPTGGLGNQGAFQ